MRRLLKSTRAVSPVFTTVLLILVVVLGMSMAFAYLVSYVKDFQIGRGSAAMELFCIEDVWFKGVGGSGPIEISVYNYGKVDVNVTGLYVNGQPIGFNQPSGHLAIPIGGHGNVTTVNVRLDPDVPYYFRLVTERGSICEGEYVSPSEGEP